MKVAIFTDTYSPDINGVVTSVRILEDELIKHGHQVYIVTSSDNKLISREDNLIRLPGIQIKKLYNYNFSGFYSSKAIRYLEELNLDVIHTQTEFGVGMFARIAALSLDLPLVYTYHTMYEDYTHYLTRYTRGLFEKTMQKTIAQATRIVSDRSTQLIVPSYKTADMMFRYGIKNTISVVPTGIKLEQFNVDNINQDNIKQLRNKLGIKDDDFVMINLGRIAPEKNTIEIVEAFKIIKAKNLDYIKLLIVGDGPALPSLEEEVKNNHLDNVMCIGKIQHSEVATYFHLADGFVSTSLSETQGLTYLEAMASGLFVIARKDKNLLGLIDEDTNGYFIDNSQELADKIIELSKCDKTKRQELSTNAFNKAQTYSSDEFYKKIMVVYQNAVASHREKKLASYVENKVLTKRKKII